MGARHIHLETHLTPDKLERRYLRAHDPVEHRCWRMQWRLAHGHTAAVTATALTGYSDY